MGTNEEYAVISNTINILCTLCAASRDLVIDSLTGILWDEKEANGIKRVDDRWDIIKELEDNLLTLRVQNKLLQSNMEIFKEMFPRPTGAGGEGRE